MINNITPQGQEPPTTPIKAAHEAAPTTPLNDKASRSRLRFFSTLTQTILLRPITTAVSLTYRTVNLLTWVSAKTILYKLSGHYKESETYFENEYLKTVKALRDFIFIPSVVARAFTDMVATHSTFSDDIPQKPSEAYLNVKHNKEFNYYSTHLHRLERFAVIRPEGITELPATNDPTLKAVMASHIFKPGMMAINFGCPNVATFITEEKEDGSVKTSKVDAKSLYREEMSFHDTSGKVQSGIFLIPTNLDEEALDRFKKAAEKMEKRKDITCVNTNCRVLEEAGFSIEGISMKDIVFPDTLMEHLLFRHVFYTDSKGAKHKVHFDILNTTQQSLQDYVKDVDTAVVGTRLRHRRRHGDTEESQKARGEAAKALIAEEAKRLKEAGTGDAINDQDLEKRNINVSVPSYLGQAVTSIWGRHTIYEVDLSDKKDEIAQAFQDLADAGVDLESKEIKLRPFPQKKPNFITRMKRDFLFSGPVIRFFRRHMMGRMDNIRLHTKDMFKHLKSTQGEHLNYVVLNDKIVLAKVHANQNSKEAVRKISDWVLSKHALLANRQEVYCSGEIWYDKAKDRFMLNDDSGTYKPTPDRVKVVAQLANAFFKGASFEATAVGHEEDVKAMEEIKQE